MLDYLELRERTTKSPRAQNNRVVEAAAAYVRGEWRGIR